MRKETSYGGKLVSAPRFFLHTSTAADHLAVLVLRAALQCRIPNIPCSAIRSLSDNTAAVAPQRAASASRLDYATRAPRSTGYGDPDRSLHRRH